MIILGLNAYHGDASAAIVVDGKLVAAVEEERFNRIKHSAGFPEEAVKYCLKEAALSIKEIDFIAIPREPKARFLRKLYYGLRIPKFALRRFTALKKTINIKGTLAKIFDIDKKEIRAEIVNVEHHRAHNSSSFFVSPFEKAFLVSVDGLGDFASASWGVGQGSKIKIIGEVTFPHSLGMFYTALTQYLGFLNYGDEYKVMGLSAYGEPEYKKEFQKIVQAKNSPKFELGLEYFVHHKKLVDMNFEEGYPVLEPLYSPYMERRLGDARSSEESIETHHINIASTLQKHFEDIFFNFLNSIYSGVSNFLCLSGGVALNCVANGKIFDNTPFQEIYIPPAAGDAGLAIGAAYYVWHQILDKPRDFIMEHSYWGPEFSEAEVEKLVRLRSPELKEKGCEIRKIEDEVELCRITAEEIANGKIVGWFQGRMEWGPRALGNRSIVVDPRKKEMKDILNKRVKHREPFRPFAPSILEEYTGEYFEKSYSSPFMLFAFKVKHKKREIIPAPTHVDGTGRLQTVCKKTNPLYWKLIDEFRKITGVPVVLNTSFNENEPIVCTPCEAIYCFLRTKMDVLTIGNYVIEKNDN